MQDLKGPRNGRPRSRHIPLSTSPPPFDHAFSWTALSALLHTHSLSLSLLRIFFVLSGLQCTVIRLPRWSPRFHVEFGGFLQSIAWGMRFFLLDLNFFCLGFRFEFGFFFLFLNFNCDCRAYWRLGFRSDFGGIHLPFENFKFGCFWYACVSRRASKIGFELMHLVDNMLPYWFKEWGLRTSYC